MEPSTALRFVMVRAQAEAQALAHRELFPEHLLLGILKYAELSAEEIAPSSRHKEEMDQDIALVRKVLK